ncbi:MAG: GNAT family N-acetyltransferase [gamma proteobacterium symbiont of Bathyaustriella thionipta]|nr:GNAT family N-acetyltransferase [gamma proteobacterium symbiont of Bathyaustriella thionipta]MCU7950778.1 GNAT family N-acetyltransferase [gamma proteobacterium symbiont of Bathyaustriella thionipta]MCU7953140.1 GNAT family N-acetyltransferase [gamma proteobacterium symbiont of Bathyaustriella thionipta]MCU7957294.1 GNAT family N-acetyltransferase [gamma proteobacterium symbiont of Bathyaustriella thionipta]MCU7966178.1 GNAT family N-acetyltransferase [gamma proteobacterium symbiont of Bathy
MQKTNTQGTKINSDYCFQVTDWSSHYASLKSIREQVFILEQNVPVELEWDGQDDNACHIIAEVIVQGKKLAIGTAQITLNNTNDHISTAHIGRMAVLAVWRGQGIGSGILRTAVEQCHKLKIKKIVLNAQVDVIPFYQKAGFEISSDEFLDADIPHKQMTRLLED